MAMMLALVAALSFIVSVSSAFTASAKTNVAVYWGQGPYQDRLVETCKNPNIDIVVLGFINVFPDNGPGGYPGSNFANACSAATYNNSAGVKTALRSHCPYIGTDIKTCQKTYGKKVLLSLGGGHSTGQYIASNASAVSFAQFLWGAFGPVTTAWYFSKGPRPFGDAVVDGFDFDIESNLAKPPVYKGVTINDYKTRGYAKMIQTFKQQLFKKDTTKSYYISASPSCVIPDAHFADLVKTSWFDFLYVRFYNTPRCSARAGVNHLEGASSIDMTYNQWSKINFHNPNLKLYIGLPASTDATGSYDYYLPPKEADLLIRHYYKNAKFGGVMLWEATHGAANVVCAMNYPTWIKSLLNAVKNGKKLNTTTNDCPNPNVPCGSCPTTPVSTTGRCGPNFGLTCSGSKFGPCCSTDGYCSSSYDVCSSSAGCDDRFADCAAAAEIQPPSSSTSSTKLSTSSSKITRSTSASSLQLTSSSISSTQATTSITATSALLSSSSTSLTKTTTPGPAQVKNFKSLASDDQLAQKVIKTRRDAGHYFTLASGINGTYPQPSRFGNGMLPSTTSSSQTITSASLHNAVGGSSSSQAPISTTNSGSNFTSASIQADAQLGSIQTADTTRTITIFSTEYLTITEPTGTQTITSLIPVATTTIVGNAAQDISPIESIASKTDQTSALALVSDKPTAFANASDITFTSTITDYATETTSTCASTVTDCSAHPESQTITLTITKTIDVYTTVIIEPLAASPATKVGSLTGTTGVTQSDATVTSVVTKYATETITTCAPSVSACEQHPESRTITLTVTNTIDVYTTVLITNAPVATPANAAASDETSTEQTTVTSYQTDFYTTTVDVMYAQHNGDNSLYNPHASTENDTTTTTVTTLHKTSTIYLTETVDVERSTRRTTQTVVSTYTVIPVGKYPQKPAPSKDTLVKSPQEQAAQVAAAAAVNNKAQNKDTLASNEDSEPDTKVGQSSSASDGSVGTDSGSGSSVKNTGHADSNADPAAAPVASKHLPTGAAGGLASSSTNSSGTYPAYHSPTFAFADKNGYKIAAVLNAGSKLDASSPPMSFVVALIVAAFLL